MGGFLPNEGRITNKRLLAVSIFSLVYGFTLINYIDLNEYLIRSWAPDGWYSFIFVVFCGLPFVPLSVWATRHQMRTRYRRILIVLGFGLLVTLCNDLGLGLSWYSFGATKLNYEWMYTFNLGLAGTITTWTAQFGIVQVPVSSFLMAGSVYARIAIVALIGIFLKQNTPPSNGLLPSELDRGGNIRPDFVPKDLARLAKDTESNRLIPQ